MFKQRFSTKLLGWFAGIFHSQVVLRKKIIFSIPELFRILKALFRTLKALFRTLKALLTVPLGRTV